jgi:two-component system phosphate regulon sensor histidine kinase PhoR
MTFLDLVLILAVVGLAVWLIHARRQNGQLRDQLARQAEKAQQLDEFQRSVETRIDAMINAPPHALLVLSSDGTILRTNHRASEILGPAIINLTVIEATRSHEIDAVVQRTLSQHRIEERPVTWNARPYFARAVPVGDGGAVLALEDQTDRLRLERVRRDFVANVSHELRTPLASVRLLIETLLSGALEEPETATRMLNQMLGEVDSMTQLAQELLDLSMIESGQMPMQMTRANLSEIVDEQIVHYEAMTQQKRLSVEDRVPIDMIAEVDRKMIGRVLGNLIHNAIKIHTGSWPHLN